MAERPIDRERQETKNGLLSFMDQSLKKLNAKKLSDTDFRFSIEKAIKRADYTIDEFVKVSQVREII
jgi:oligoribonuclease NrnB/cAMP/cGMP phosphodiesterase (DHH superfamily)